ncbi:MAG TPA: glycosyltransferase [Acidimicrobiales bacterium]|nr:glycosyltransferase [Acidimicrobiales bacterium]
MPPTGRLRVAISVAAFLQAPDFGGPVTKVALLAEGLVARGHEVTVLTADYGPNRSRVPARVDTIDGYTAHYLKTVARYRWSPIPAPGELRRLDWDFDVVHVCGLRDGLGYAVTRQARRRRIPYVIEPLGMVPAQLRNVLLKSAVDRFITTAQLAGARTIIATSEVERRQLESKFTLPRLDIRPNPVAVAASAPRPAPAVTDRARLLFVGRICRTKGLLNLVEAVRPLDNVQLTIAGPDDQDGTSEALRVATATLPPGRVVMHGWVTPAERDRLIAESHIAVLPSVTENFGNFAIEAASGQRPVVVTRTSGVAEFLADAALIVEPNAEALRAAIVRLVDDPELRAALAARGHDRATALAPATVAEAQERIYGDALRSPHRTP